MPTTSESVPLIGTNIMLLCAISPSIYTVDTTILLNIIYIIYAALLWHLLVLLYYWTGDLLDSFVRRCHLLFTRYYLVFSYIESVIHTCSALLSSCIFTSLLCFQQCKHWFVLSFSVVHFFLLTEALFWYINLTGVTILLSLTVFSNMVNDTMPTTSDAVPLLGNPHSGIGLSCII